MKLSDAKAAAFELGGPKFAEGFASPEWWHSDPDAVIAAWAREVGLAFEEEGVTEGFQIHVETEAAEEWPVGVVWLFAFVVPEDRELCAATN